ncbi:MAG TPA: M50 family metallopeptidase [Haloplasmataceae bacterium]
MIKISLLTYVYLLIALMSGYFYELLCYYISLFFHEAGHLLMIGLLKKRVVKIEFSPIGGVIEVDGLVNELNSKAFLIYSGGPLFSLIFFLCAFFCRWNDTFVLSSFLTLVLNLIPILPFDGGELLKILLQNLWWYKRVYTIAHLLSIGILLLGIYLLWGNVLFLVIIGYFMILNIKGLKERAFHYYQFLLMKYWYPNPLLPIKILQKDYYQRLYKGYNNSLYHDGQYIDETTMLKRRFAALEPSSISD